MSAGRSYTHHARLPKYTGHRSEHAAEYSRSAVSAVPVSPALLATPRRGPVEAHTGSSTVLPSAVCRPRIRPVHASSERTSRLPLGRQAPTIFSDRAL
jgi:hypothetical protein